jgi:hypothetical protein
VEVVGAADVVAWDDGDEGSGAVGRGGLHATESVGLDSGGRAVAVTPGLYTSVDTGGVGAPELDIGVGHGLAAGNVDHIEIEMGDSTLLASENV